MKAKEHYDTHLASFYSRMSGDFESKQNEQEAFLRKKGILPKGSGITPDLGAGYVFKAYLSQKLTLR